MIRKHLDLLYRPFAIPSPVLEDVDYCKKFFIVDFVIYLRGLDLSGMESYRVEPPFVVLLQYDRSDGEIQGVRLNDNWSLSIEVD